MFSAKKLAELSPSQRRRKIILLLASLERALLNGSNSSDDERMVDGELLELCRLAALDTKISEEDKTQIELLSDKLRGHPEDPPTAELRLRLCNTTRNIMLKAAGTFPAEWDLIHPERGSQAHGLAQRFCHKGIRVFLEDIRSPFNVGSIFRTAEAFGVERLYLAPGCAPAEHPRARRSGMGSIDFLPWERKTLEQLPEGFTLFALETGGTPLEKFSFPKEGIAIIGSEELGVSPEALEKASSRVSIQLCGIKASLNVGVAFGILMQAWTQSLPLMP